MSVLPMEKKQAILEAALMVSDSPLSIANLQQLFAPEENLPTHEIKSLLAAIAERHSNSGIQLQEVATGYRFQAASELAPWLAKLYTERAPRYSRAFLETLAIIAYRQPITRAEIEEIRGVTVSSNIMKSLTEREWVRILGYREVPGKPALYGTTKAFLDYFNLKSLSQMPTLAEFASLEVQDAALQVEFALENNELPNADDIASEQTLEDESKVA